MSGGVDCLGVDGCSAGWFFCRRRPDGAMDYGVAADFSTLLRGLSPGARLVVDIPIGLLESGAQERECDRLARRMLSPGRGSSVFPAPCRQAVYAEDYARAAAINRRVLGRGLSRQSWNIAAKIREVDAVLQAGSGHVAVREGHPELSFRALAGRPVAGNKKTREGVHSRLELLSPRLTGIRALVAEAFLEHGGFDCGRDDIIDAAVLLLAAIHWEQCLSVPEDPPADPKGLSMAIHYLSMVAPSD
ncbi:DUF429 domain-containing protein [Ectothiorhodospiraceae bacterium WFHF3C12]|nr:DUF429 domain-containing protein [Ectothiorhodospiraceae bacterium WFHF3C12]